MGSERSGQADLTARTEEIRHADILPFPLRSATGDSLVIRTRSLERLDDLDLLARVLGVTRQRLDTFESTGPLPPLLDDAHGLALRGLDAKLTRRLIALRVFLGRLLQLRLAIPAAFDRPKEIAAFIALRHFRHDQEVCGALFLDAGLRLIADEALFHGTLSAVSVEPRPFLRRALALAAPQILVFHTHASTDPKPSEADLAFTRRLVQAGEIVGVRVIDHIIVTGRGPFVTLRSFEPGIFT